MRYAIGQAVKLDAGRIGRIAAREAKRDLNIYLIVCDGTARWYAESDLAWYASARTV
jgi:hypothetical protein